MVCECLFWPNLNAEIKEYILQCERCGQYSVIQPKETLMSCEATERPWEKIEADTYTINSKEFAKFTREWDFIHRTSSSGHQQGNGKAKLAVKMAKNVLWKAKESKADPYVAIIAMLNTLTEDMNKSSAKTAGKVHLDAPNYDYKTTQTPPS